jgi:2,4-dienoyl-CoA reductase (NADPH2)
MARFRRFNLEDTNHLMQEMDALNRRLPISDNLGRLGESVSLGTRTLPNRFVIQPMEGVDADPADGSPSDLTFRRYRRYAEGGSGLIWAEAVSVVPEGCSNSKQLRLRPENLDVFKRLTDETRQTAHNALGHDITMLIQLTHSGRFSRPGGVVSPLKAQNNPWLDDFLGMGDLAPVSDDYLDSLQDDFVRTAELAVRAGFDGVDMKAVHGYLTAELLGAHRREGKYGGSYENRTRFLRETSQGMMESLPAGSVVTTRMTVLEPCPYPYGWGVTLVPGDTWELDLTEPKRLMSECLASGMPIFNVSMGFPGSSPTSTGRTITPWPVRTILPNIPFWE